MSRINVYEQIDYDADWMRRDEKPALLGWFESTKADRWSDQDYNGNGSGGTGRGQAGWRTAQGKWVLENWTRWQDESSTYAYIGEDDARDWLLRNDEDDAVNKFLGEVAEEEDRRPGRPAVGEAVQIRLGDDLLGRVDAYARMNNHSRAEAVRVLLGEALNAGQPYAVTYVDVSNGQRETDSRHSTLGAAVEALRVMQRADYDDQQQQGLPSCRPRVEHDGRPVDVEAVAG